TTQRQPPLHSDDPVGLWRRGALPVAARTLAATRAAATRGGHRLHLVSHAAARIYLLFALGPRHAALAGRRYGKLGSGTAGALARSRPLAHRQCTAGSDL